MKKGLTSHSLLMKSISRRNTKQRTDCKSKCFFFPYIQYRKCYRYNRIHCVLPDANQLQPRIFVLCRIAKSRSRVKIFKRGRISTTPAQKIILSRPIIIYRKGCHINNQTGCLEMLWNPHPFKKEIKQVSGLRTCEKLDSTQD